MKRAEPRDKSSNNSNSIPSKYSLSGINQTSNGDSTGALRLGYLPQSLTNLPVATELTRQQTALMTMATPAPVWTAVTPITSGINWMSPLPTIPGYPAFYAAGGLNAFPPSVWNPSLVTPASYAGRSSVPLSGQSTHASGVIPTSLPTPGTPVAAVTLSSIPLLNPLTGDTAQEVASFGPTHRLMTAFPASPFNGLDTQMSIAMTGNGPSSSSRVTSQTHSFHPYRRV